MQGPWTLCEETTLIDVLQSIFQVEKVDFRKMLLDQTFDVTGWTGEDRRFRLPESLRPWKRRP